jgi:hypothetical protein
MCTVIRSQFVKLASASFTAPELPDEVATRGALVTDAVKETVEEPTGMSAVLPAVDGSPGVTVTSLYVGSSVVSYSDTVMGDPVTVGARALGPAAAVAVALAALMRTRPR